VVVTVTSGTYKVAPCAYVWYPVQNAQFMLLSTYLASERLQRDTDLLVIITNTADDL